MVAGGLSNRRNCGLVTCFQPHSMQSGRNCAALTMTDHATGGHVSRKLPHEVALDGRRDVGDHPVGRTVGHTGQSQ